MAFYSLRCKSQFGRNPKFSGYRFAARFSNRWFLSAFKLSSYSLSLVFPQFIIERVNSVGGFWLSAYRVSWLTAFDCFVLNRSVRLAVLSSFVIGRSLQCQSEVGFQSKS